MWRTGLYWTTYWYTKLLLSAGSHSSSRGTSTVRESTLEEVTFTWVGLLGRAASISHSLHFTLCDYQSTFHSPAFCVCEWIIQIIFITIFYHTIFYPPNGFVVLMWLTLWLYTWKSVFAHNIIEFFRTDKTI